MQACPHVPVSVIALRTRRVSLEAGVLGSCELTDAGSGTLTWIFGESSHVLDH